ncbi:Peptidase A1 domain-containing protein [Aphelenchoides bicaudatus]|nr:Peptidase A1 domain-containing protein [Aphelenchoides bicaudatus]
MAVLRVLLVQFLLISFVYSQLEVSVKRKHKTKKAHIARDAGSKTTTTNSSDGYTEKMQAFQNLEYKGTVSIGTPPQVFEVIMDTGSDVFWLPRVGCRSSGPDVHSCLSGQGLYDPSKSSTANNLNQRLQIQYGTGSASGQYFSDEMSFGDANGNHVSVGKVTLGAASQMTFSDEGILGLSFSQRGDPTPIFELAVQRGVFSQPVFSVYLADCDSDECENGGIIKFGGSDISHCNAVIGTAQVVGQTPYWLFEVSGITVGGRTISTSTKAIVDTGTSIIAGPARLIQQIAASFGAQVTQGTYLVPCNANLQINFQINRQTYTVTSAELILAGPVASDGRQSYCQLAIDGDSQLDFVILGSPFIRAYCLIHNVKDKTVSFAPVKNRSQPNTNNELPQTSITGTSGSSGRGQGNNNNWPFGGTNNNWPFGNVNDNWPFGQTGDPFGSWGSPFSSSSSPFGNSGNNWPFNNKNPYGSPWSSNQNFPFSSTWNMPNDGGFWLYERPYAKK